MTTDIRSTEAGDTLAYELRIEAPPEIVWRLWTEPEEIVRWMGKVATLAAEPGGAWRIDYGQGDAVSGTYVEVEPERRLEFTWGWETPAGRDPAGVVEVELEAAAEGAATLLRLRHRGLDAPARKSHDEGWRYFLPKLVEAATA